jgi:glutamate---cysteine ligase / carboxylate-amine ligase
MTLKTSNYSFGIEEEYYLVHASSRALVKEPPRRLLTALKKAHGHSFSEEFMRSQIEISTPVCGSADEARASLIDLRRSIARQARRYGLAPIAAATHPFTLWRHQRHRDSLRYNAIADDFQALGRRMLICGLHVHIGVEKPEDRIALMNDLRPYLPLFLALSGSSPFWGGESTGLKSYRTAINDATPRKGIPEPFANWRDFERAVAVLVDAGVIEDATKIWWDVRPSVRYPTLEVRIMDVCPLIEDTIAITCLLRCLCRYLDRTRTARHGRPVASLLCNENRWRAQRYGLSQGFVDTEHGGLVATTDLVEMLLDRTAEDAAHFGCGDEIEHIRTIVARGTSADRQLARYETLIASGATRGVALAGVVDQLIEDTLSDVADDRSGSRTDRTSVAAAAVT